VHQHRLGGETLENGLRGYGGQTGLFGRCYLTLALERAMQKKQAGGKWAVGRLVENHAGQNAILRTAVARLCVTRYRFDSAIRAPTTDKSFSQFETPHFNPRYLGT
jgi:hypothetical protein